MTLEAARRVYERKASMPVLDKPTLYGPWHVRNVETGFTLCGQGLRGTRPYQRSDAGSPPAGGKLCTRCWDRQTGKRAELDAARARVRTLDTNPTKDPSA